MHCAVRVVYIQSTLLFVYSMTGVLLLQHMPGVLLHYNNYDSAGGVHSEDYTCRVRIAGSTSALQ